MKLQRLFWNLWRRELELQCRELESWPRQQLHKGPHFHQHQLRSSSTRFVGYLHSQVMPAFQKLQYHSTWPCKSTLNSYDKPMWAKTPTLKPTTSMQMDPNLPFWVQSEWLGRVRFCKSKVWFPILYSQHSEGPQFTDIQVTNTQVSNRLGRGFKQTQPLRHQQNKEWKLFGDNPSSSITWKVVASCCGNREYGSISPNSENLGILGAKRKGWRKQPKVSLALELITKQTL